MLTYPDELNESLAKLAQHYFEQGYLAGFRNSAQHLMALVEVPKPWASEGLGPGGTVGRVARGVLSTR